MRAIPLPESGSKKKLLDIAEQLFAERGFEAVSVRDITQLAKANVAAVNYHFGSRDNLLSLVMMRYMLPVTEEQLARLDVIERKGAGKAAVLEEIMDALFRPLVEQVAKSELSEPLFYKLIGRIFTQQADGLPAPVEELLRQASVRFIRSFSKVLPTVDSEDLIWRIHFMVGGMIHLLTHQDIAHGLTHRASGVPTMEVTLSRFIRYSAVGLREGMEAEVPEKNSPQATFDF